MDLKGKKIILASASPRRKELLAGLNIEFEIDTLNGFDESYDPLLPQKEIPSALSEGKSLGFHRELLDNEILITADTLVLCEGRIMGKPKNRADAIDMLKHLSGKTHEVVTAITLRDSKHYKTLSDTSIVHFKKLSEKEIEYYVDEYKPMDKAGAYGIQEWIGYIGIPMIEGSFFTIMGFPTHLVYSLLLDFINS